MIMISDYQKKRLSYFLREKRWHTDGLSLFYSILSLMSFILLALNVAALAGAIAIPALLLLFSMFVSQQFRITGSMLKATQLPEKHDVNIYKYEFSHRLSKSMLLLCGYAVMILFYFYVTVVAPKPSTTATYVLLCAAGLILYVFGLLMLHRLHQARKRLIDLQASDRS
jgi:hypothetical protein